MKTLKFWTWLNNSLIKLTINAGQTIIHKSGGRTEEGYHYTTDVYSFDGEFLYLETIDEGLDCDGRLETITKAKCSPDNIAYYSVFENFPRSSNLGIYTPKWEETNSSVYDQYAQMMNY